MVNMIIAEKIIFSIMAFYLFIIMFFKMIKKSDTVYIVVLLMQAIGIAFNFIEIIFKWNINIFVKLLIFLISIIIPFVIITVEIKGQNVAEILKLLLVKIALKSVWLVWNCSSATTEPSPANFTKAFLKKFPKPEE